MSVSSAQDEDWSIISSSSDLDEDISLSYTQHSNNCEESEDEGDVKSDVNDTFDSRVLSGGKLRQMEEVNQEASTATITGDSATAAEQKPILAAGMLLKNDSALKSEASAGRDHRAGSRKDRCAVRQLTSCACCVACRIDKNIRSVSAMGYDFTWGVILAGFRRKKETYSAQSSPMNLVATKFLNASIFCLELIELQRELWLYTMLLVTVAEVIWRVYGTAAPAPQPSSYFQVWSDPEKWSKYYDMAMYESGPLKRSFFGISAPGPKKLRVVSYYNGVREWSQTLWNQVKAEADALYIIQRVKKNAYLKHLNDRLSLISWEKSWLDVANAAQVAMNQLRHNVLRVTAWVQEHKAPLAVDSKKALDSIKHGLQAANGHLEKYSLYAAREFHKLQRAASPYVSKGSKYLTKYLKEYAAVANKSYMSLLSKAQSQFVAYEAEFRKQSVQFMRAGVLLFKDSVKYMKDASKRS